MISICALAARARLSAATALVSAIGLLVLLAGTAAAAPAVGTFQKRASSPKPVNNVVVDPTTNMIYAQQFEGRSFYRYNPHTNTWKRLANSPIPQGNNGGAAYLNGKIYTVYTEDGSVMGVYNIATGKWGTAALRLSGEGTGDITAAGGLLYVTDGIDLRSFNPATHTWRSLTDPPFEITQWGGLASYRGKIYADEGNGNNPDNFGVYDIATDSWTQLTAAPGGAVLGAAIDPVSGTFFAYGSYGGSSFYSYDIAAKTWQSTTFPYTRLNDGGMAYVSAKGLQGIYATYGEGNRGFTRYVTPPPKR